MELSNVPLVSADPAGSQGQKEGASEWTGLENRALFLKLEGIFITFCDKTVSLPLA